MEGLADVVIWLLEQGARTDIEDAYSQTAWEACTSPRRQDVRIGTLRNGALENRAVSAFLRHYFRTEVSGDWFWCTFSTELWKPSQRPGYFEIDHLPPEEPDLSEDALEGGVTYAASANNVSSSS